jgi:Hint domain
MLDFEKLPTGIRRSRRNIVKMGVIGASAAVARLTTTGPAAADQNNNNQGQNNNNQNRQSCFLKGTTIRTAEGDRKIEDLAVGDLLPTVFGGTCPIQRMGYYRYRTGDQANDKPWWVKDELPVRVARYALSAGMPNADLCITKAHALLIDGLLVPAGSLINGTTITLYDAHERDELEFFHIKLARHDVIYAEAAPCETLWIADEEVQCAPRVGIMGGRGEMRSRLRSAISPWIDRRQEFDVIRDNLEERGIALLQQTERVW